jgi:hypothetical protein
VRTTHRLLVPAAAVVAAEDVVPENTACRYQCPAGSSCRRLNQHYYQCTPNHGGGGDGAGGGSSGLLAAWQQCGGTGGDCGSYGACADAPYSGRACPSGREVFPGCWADAVLYDGIAGGIAAAVRRCCCLATAAAHQPHPRPRHLPHAGTSCERLNQAYHQCRPAGFGACRQVRAAHGSGMSQARAHCCSAATHQRHGRCSWSRSNAAACRLASGSSAAACQAQPGRTPPMRACAAPPAPPAHITINGKWQPGVRGAWTGGGWTLAAALRCVQWCTRGAVPMARTAFEMQ